jgi:hypothetical protein
LGGGGKQGRESDTRDRRYADAPAEGVDKIPANFLWKGASLLAAVWAVSLAYFAGFVAVPKFRHTLWSGTTGRKVMQDLFLDGADDGRKFNVFWVTRLGWEAEIGTEVKAWTMGNWERWVEEKPDWFSEVKISVVPDEYIPPRFLAGWGGANRERRGSAALSVRESMRGSARRRSEREGVGEGGGEDM